MWAAPVWTAQPVLFEMPAYRYLRTGDVLGECMTFGNDVTILDPIGVYRPDVPRARRDIQQGAAGLDLEVR